MLEQRFPEGSDFVPADVLGFLRETLASEIDPEDLEGVLAQFEGVGSWDEFGNVMMRIAEAFAAEHGHGGDEGAAKLIDHIASDIFSRFNPEENTLAEVLDYIRNEYLNHPEIDPEAVEQLLGKLSEAEDIRQLG